MQISNLEHIMADAGAINLLWLRLETYTIVTGQGIGEKDVFLLCARADVVQGKRNARRRLSVADDHFAADGCTTAAVEARLPSESAAAISLHRSGYQAIEDFSSPSLRPLRISYGAMTTETFLIPTA